MFMKDEKALAIFHLAQQQTLKGKLRWQQMEGSMSDVFEVVTPGGFTLRVYPHTTYDDSEGAGPPSLTLFDTADKMVFDITLDLTGVTESELRDLYVMSRRIALGIDAKLELILKDLSSMTENSD